MSFKTYYKNIKEILEQKILESLDFIDRMKYLSYSEKLSDAMDGHEIGGVEEKRLRELLAVQTNPCVIYNATPHPIDMLDEKRETIHTIKPCGLVARMGTHTRHTHEKLFILAPVDLAGLYLPIIKTVITEQASEEVVLDLPPYEEGVYYIVSALVFMSLPSRKDLLQVDPVRDEKGFTIGAKGFIAH